jgi:hypothetical protein
MTIPAVPYRVKTAALTVRTASTTLGVKGPMAANVRRWAIAPELDGASGSAGFPIVILQQVEPVVGRPGRAGGPTDFAVRDANWACIVSEQTQGGTPRRRRATRPTRRSISTSVGEPSRRDSRRRRTTR